MISKIYELRRKTALKAGFWYVIGNLSQRAIAFLSLPLIARLLLPEQIGVVSVWQGWVSILTIVFTLNVSVSVTNAATDLNADAYAEFLSSIVVTGVVSSVIGVTVLLLLPSSISETIFGLPSTLVFLAGIVGSMAGIVQIRMMAYRQKYRYFSYNILAIGVQLAAVSLSILLIVLPPRVWPQYDVTYGQPLGVLVSAVIPFVFVFYTSVRKVKNWFRTEYAQYALAISVPLILHTIAHSLLSRSDTYLISQLIGERETGIYSIAYRFGEIVLIVWAGTTNVWTVWFFERMKAGDQGIIRKRARQYVFGFAAITLVLMIAAPIAFKWFTPSVYWDGIRLVPVIMLAGFFTMLYGLYIPVEYFYKRTRLTGVLTLLAAATNIILNLLFLPKFGYEAAAFTTVAAYALMFVGHAYYVESKFEVSGMFDLRLLISAGTGMTVLGIGIGALMGAVLNT